MPTSVNTELPIVGIADSTPNVVDGLAFAKLYDDPGAQKFSLRALCDYFGVKNEHAHSAMSDIKATFEVYKKLMGLD